MPSPCKANRAGHTLVELIAAMVTGSILLAGLASVMFVGREVAYAPTASHDRVTAAQVLHELADELRWATFIVESTPHTIEFVTADRNGDGAAERFRYAWSGTPGDPLCKSHNAGDSLSILEDVKDFSAAPETTVVESLSVEGQSINRESIRSVSIALQPGETSHSRIETSVALANQPELLAAYWRLDFEEGENPVDLDVNADGTVDWQTSNGAPFPTGSLQNGLWSASSLLHSHPLHNFAGITTIEARFRGTNAGFRIPADRQAGRFGPITVALVNASDGSRTLRLLDDSSAKLQKVDNSGEAEVPYLSIDFVRVRLTIVPTSDTVVLHVNDEEVGAYRYPTIVNASASDRSIVAGVLSGAAEFDYIDVRVRP